MTKTIEKPQIVKREVGEKVQVHAVFEKDSVKDLGDGQFEAVVTTSEFDRTQESIATDGVDPTSWEKTGMPVLYGHDYGALPIGKGISWKKFKNKMTAKFQLAVEEYDFAGTVAKLIKGGYLSSVSIGGIVKEWSDDYRTILQMEMVEFSVVPIPANASAVITGKALEKATGKTEDAIRDEYQDFARKVLLDKMKSMGEDEVNDAIKVLKNLVARLEETANSPSTHGAKKIHVVRSFTLKDAQAVATQSQRVIKTIKLSIKG